MRITLRYSFNDISNLIKDYLDSICDVYDVEITYDPKTVRYYLSYGYFYCGKRETLSKIYNPWDFNNLVCMVLNAKGYNCVMARTETINSRNFICVIEEEKYLGETLNRTRTTSINKVVSKSNKQY